MHVIENKTYEQKVKQRYKRACTYIEIKSKSQALQKPSHCHSEKIFNNMKSIILLTLS